MPLAAFTRQFLEQYLRGFPPRDGGTLPPHTGHGEASLPSRLRSSLSTQTVYRTRYFSPNRPASFLGTPSAASPSGDKRSAVQTPPSGGTLPGGEARRYFATAIPGRPAATARAAGVFRNRDNWTARKFPGLIAHQKPRFSRQLRAPFLIRQSVH
jgi:hypothetical protein